MNASVTSVGADRSLMSITCTPPASQVGSRNAVRYAYSPWANTSATRPVLPAPLGLVTSLLPTRVTLSCLAGRWPPSPSCCLP